jgi:ribonuclease Z
MTQRMVVLGAGTALPDRDRDNTFLVWDSPAGSVLIDCGGRAYQQLLRAEIDPQTITSVILTHNHPDHIYGLPAFVFHLWLAKYQQTLDVYANAPTLKTAQALCNALDLEQNGHMCPVRWHTLPDVPDAMIMATEHYSISTAPVQHSRPTHAVKIVDLRSKHTLVYSSDTRPCEEVRHFARGAHTLIHEATTAEPAPEQGHTTPREAGEIAQACGVERLVLIHYSAEYTMREADAIAAVQESGFAGEVLLAQELAAYSLEA